MESGLCSGALKMIRTAFELQTISCILFTTPDFFRCSQMLYPASQWRSIACGDGAKLGRCVFDDIVSELAPKFETCGGQLGVLRLGQRHSGGAAHPAVLQHSYYKTRKGGASVVVARRGGLSAPSMN